MSNIDASARAQIAAQLERAIIQVLETYLSYSSQTLRTAPERLLDNERAARIAQAHFRLLTKAQDWACAADQAIADAELAALTSEAQAELAGRE